MQCGITSFPMGEIGMVFAPPEDSRLFGVTVKDSNTSDFTLYLYRDCRCEVSQPVAPTRVAQLIIGSRDGVLQVWHR